MVSNAFFNRYGKSFGTIKAAINFQMATVSHR